MELHYFFNPLPFWLKQLTRKSSAKGHLDLGGSGHPRPAMAPKGKGNAMKRPAAAVTRRPAAAVIQHLGKGKDKGTGGPDKGKGGPGQGNGGPGKSNGGPGKHIGGPGKGNAMQRPAATVTRRPAAAVTQGPSKGKGKDKGKGKGKDLQSECGIYLAYVQGWRDSHLYLTGSSLPRV